MALVTTVTGVIGVLAAMALLLWFSAYIEARHLGPVIPPRETERLADLTPTDLIAAEVPQVGAADAISSAA